MSGEGFLDRWSRRKREAREETTAPERPSAIDEPKRGEVAPAPQTSRAPDEAGDEKTLAERLAELPRIEEIDQLTDMTRFMQPWVPESLRREALRKLWTVDRAVRDHVIFADYALDYNTPGAAPGYGTIETTADMVREALGSFSRDPVETLRRDAESQGRKQADEDGATPDESAAEEAGSPPPPEPVRPLAEHPVRLDERRSPPPATSEAPPPAADPDAVSVAAREEPVFAAPLPPHRRRHGSAAPR